MNSMPFLQRVSIRAVIGFSLIIVLQTSVVIAQGNDGGQKGIPRDSLQEMLNASGIRSLSDTSQGIIRIRPQNEIDYWRLTAVIGTAVSTLGASYLYLQDTWWKDNTTEFHLDTGNDLHYAKNLDKAAHFYGGIIAADLSYGALRWSGFTEEQAHWYGVLFAAFIQAAIETKDGYSPRWGFSLLDVGMGTLGSLYPVAQYYFEPLRNIDIKFSYFERTDKYFTRIKSDGTGTWNDDYINQTYWASVKVNNFLPPKWQKHYPDWLAFAVGVGIDDKMTGVVDKNKPGYDKGDLELYLALDVDITALFPSDSPVWEAVKHYLNYIKFPAPAVRLTPGIVWYGLYF